MFACKSICVRCINCSYNNIARRIGLLDKIVIFVYTGNFSYKRALRALRAFEIGEPLKSKLFVCVSLPCVIQCSEEVLKCIERK